MLEIAHGHAIDAAQADLWASRLREVDTRSKCPAEPVNWAIHAASVHVRPSTDRPYRPDLPTSAGRETRRVRAGLCKT
jgi:hypothetical protein